jgi:hypothetical protein
MNENNFAEAAIEEVVLSTGMHIRLPVRYYDFSWMSALFTASVAKVLELLPQ